MTLRVEALIHWEDQGLFEPFELFVCDLFDRTKMKLPGAYASGFFVTEAYEKSPGFS